MHPTEVAHVWGRRGGQRPAVVARLLRACPPAVDMRRPHPCEPEAGSGVQREDRAERQGRTARGNPPGATRVRQLLQEEAQPQHAQQLARLRRRRAQRSEVCRNFGRSRPGGARSAQRGAGGAEGGTWNKRNKARAPATRASSGPPRSRWWRGTRTCERDAACPISTG
jgi:hypothetical protein